MLPAEYPILLLGKTEGSLGPQKDPGRRQKSPTTEPVRQP